MKRRRLFTWALRGLVAGALAEIAWVITAFVRSRSRSKADAAEALVVAGRIEDFAAGSVTAFPAHRFYLARLTDGGFLALDRRCTHLGCSVPWDEKTGHFVCPCHGSAFDIRGEVLSPPAPRPLDTYPVRVENGVVRVDVRTKHSRAQFGEEQVGRP
jgi:cytochrome b6-f complex iron-sulfur subunit